MTDVLKHRFTSAKPNGADATQIQPSHWNEGHKFEGGADGEVLARDTSDLTFGAKWIPAPTGGGGSTDLEYLGDYVPGTYNDGDIVVAADGLAYICVKNGVTTPPEPWPGVGAGGGGLATVIQSTDVGTVNDWAPPGLAGHDTLILWSGGSNFTVTGMAGGAQGQVVTFKNRGAGIVYFPFNSSSSAIGNRLIPLVTSAPTPIAVDGSAQFMYAGSGWYLVAHEQGAWITPAYSAGDYTASPGTWTVSAADVVTCRYLLSGRTLHLQFFFFNTTVAGSPNFLIRTTPGGFVTAVTGFTATRSNPGTGAALSVATFNATEATVLFWPNPATSGSWPNVTDSNNIQLSGFIEVG